MAETAKWAIILGGLLCGAVQAQSPTAFDGKWLAKFSTARGDAREAVLQVNGSGGTWEQQIKARNNPCVGVEAPVGVTVVSDTELEVKIFNSKVLSGCSDSSIKAKRVDERTLEGTLEDGRKVTLTRP